MFYGFGQYESYDPEMWKNSIYATESGGSVQSSSILPIFQSLISGASPVISKYFELQAAKQTAEAQKALAEATIKRAQLVPATGAPQTAVTPTASIIPQNWPILAIIGIGLIVALRGREKGVREIETRYYPKERRTSRQKRRRK